MKRTLLKKARFGLTCALLLSPILTSCDPGSSSLVDTDQWVITLDFNDGISRDAVLYVEKGESIVLPDNPTCEGYSFAGWKDSSGNMVTGESYTPTANTTLTAQWTTGICQVTFHANYEDGEDIVQEVEYGKTIATPPTMEREGYVFRYWAVIPDGEEIDFATYPIQGDYDFYAIWRDEGIQEYTITVHAGNYEGAPEDSTITVEQGEKIRESNRTFRVEREGYDLAGWTSVAPEGEDWTIDDYDNIDSLLPELIDFPYTPTSSTTLYAVWTIQQYRIIWNYNYTDAPTETGVYQSYSILSNELVTPPTEDPTRPGYSFMGWYSSALGNNKIEFDGGVKVKANTGYYAHWKCDPVKTNVFQAEYVYFDPNKEYWGYSGSVRGQKCIVKDGGTVGTVMVDDYPLNSVLTSHNGYYVSYQYEKGCTLTFEINSSKATTATLKGSFVVENQLISQIGSSGDYSTLIKVNGTSIDYSLNLSLVFQEYTIGTVQLKEGLNTIEIVVNNSSTVLGGTYKAAGFNTDYIKLDDCDAELSWSPIYDNLEEVQ